MKNRLLENVSPKYRNVTVRRYSLADMISESYSLLYDVPEDSRLQRMVESHIRDVKSNPRDLDRLSEQLCTLKSLRLLEAEGKSEDELLVPEKYYDTIEGKEDRVMVHPETKVCDCNESEDVADKAASVFKKNVSRLKSSKPGDDRDKAFNNARAARDIWDRNRKKEDESCNEAEEPELTDEELEELAKHLETIRKDKKEAPKHDPDQSMSESHPADCECPECSKVKEDCKESYTYNEEDDFDGNVYDQLQVSIYNDLAQVYGLSEQSISVDMEQKIGKAIRLLVEVIHECTNGDPSYLTDSKNYPALSNFKKVSESKAFFKTFKKMHESLKEGRALTRQESIDLYKAANSAMTQLSIELEHNPDFLDSFRESTQILSRDVDSLRECLSRGKAPSKNTMNSLAKFSESLLTESDKGTMTSEEAKEYWDKNNASDPVLRDYRDFDSWYKDSKDNGYIVDPDPDEEITEADDVEDEVAMDPEAEEKSVDTEEFVGDDEGDVQSEEADAFDQEYADARVELHKDIAADYKDSEDPEVVEKLEQDAEEVIDLPGTTEEQAADIQGEEVDPEDSEDDPEDDTDDANIDYSDITDDELEELKRHLQEYRQQRIKEDK